MEKMVEKEPIMTMVKTGEKEIVKYKSNDGKIFKTEEEAKTRDAKLLGQQKFNNIAKKMPCENLDWIHDRSYYPDCYMINMKNEEDFYVVLAQFSNLRGLQGELHPHVGHPILFFMWEEESYNYGCYDYFSIYDLSAVEKMFSEIENSYKELREEFVND